jgi:hypothetical protein
MDLVIRETMGSFVSMESDRLTGPFRDLVSLSIQIIG